MTRVESQRHNKKNLLSDLDILRPFAGNCSVQKVITMSAGPWT